MQLDRHYEGTDFITGLRAIAVFLVFVIHSGGGGLRDISEFLNTFVDFGKYGVQVFFVISGFTIFFQLSKEGYSLRRFLLIRIFRISIPYFPVLIFIYIYINSGGEQFNGWANQFNNGTLSIDNLLMHITYLASFDLKYANTIIGVEWTLHIEVFFYFLIGILLTRGHLKQGPLSIMFWFVIWLIIAVTLGPLGYIGTLDRLAVYWMPFIYGWMFILGGGAFYLRKKMTLVISSHLENIISDLGIIVSIVLIFGLIWLNSGGLVSKYLHLDWSEVHFLNELFVSLITATLIVTTRDAGKFSVVFTSKVALFLGAISFSFYLIHYIIIASEISYKLFYFENQTVVFFSNLFITIVVSVVWYYFFEQFLYQKAKSAINRSMTH
ncbi:acyltransferase family protein [Vibrio ouci]|nr:acyltransferase [Vibrio ouci]